MTITLNRTYTTVTCCHAGCGLTVVMDDGYYRARQRDGAFWHCLNGHPQHFTQTTEIRLQAQLDQALADAKRQTRWRRDAEQAAERARRQASARKGQVTKMRNRIAAGVCPVPGCKRSGFDNVRRHIASQHPDWHEHDDVVADGGDL